MKHSVYFDHHATTPLDPVVLEAMRPFLQDEFGNASSATHDWGRRAAEAVAQARQSVADLIGSESQEIVFTSGATEANNLAIKGAARACKANRESCHLITTVIEHKSAILSVSDLEREGFENTIVFPSRVGVVNVEAIEDAIREDTVLVSVTAADSEIGAIQPIAEIGQLCRSRGILFHTDATQYVGKVPLDVGLVCCDLLSMSAHKFYGPKGVGALYVREGVEIDPLISGGGQEMGMRSGTPNVPGIVGLGAAAGVRRRVMEDEARFVQDLRDRLWAGIKHQIPDALLNGELDRRLPGNLSICIPGCQAEELIGRLDSFALSTGSACQSAEDAPSEVLLALGRSPEQARSALRFGLGKQNTLGQVDELIAALGSAVRDARGRQGRAS